MLLNLLNFKKTMEIDPMDVSEEIKSGTVGWWDGPLGEHKIGVVLDASTLQLYRSSRLGFLPDGTPEILKEWKLSESVIDFYYEMRQNGSLYLII